jgi:hypothetical protein
VEFAGIKAEGRKLISKPSASFAHDTKVETCFAIIQANDILPYVSFRLK